MTTRQLTHAQRRSWLRLMRTDNVGAITFRQLIHRYATAETAIEALPGLAARGGKKSFVLPPWSLIDAEMAGIEKIGARLIASCEPDYPEALAAIEDAPPIIAVLGQPALMKKRIIGIVGARNASLNGRRFAENLARELGRQGIVIASGLARGIDTAAHNGSLETGTVAVIAGGVDKVYPEENRALYEQLAVKGCIVSDQPFGCEPQARLFPRRNRIISGLGLGVIVVEAAHKSGSLITARQALEQGREVFAVPGSPLDPRCRGSNDLLRQGAVLTEGAGDVLSHIHALPTRLAEPANEGLEDGSGPFGPAEMAAAQEKILENLGPSPILIDELIRECQLSAPLMLTILLELELAGRIERQPGHRVALIDWGPQHRAVGEE
ncbi:MAG: DNA-processing protein DprA [Bdellovibrionales bacterium]